MKRPGILFLFITFAFAACHKADRDLDNSTYESQDEGLAETAYGDIDAIIKEVIDNNSGLRAQNSLLTCATVYVDTVSAPKSVLVDFGNSNCTGADGRTRRGQLFATFTGKYRDSLTTLTITPQNYYLNDYKVDGVRTVVNKGHKINGNLWFTVQIQNGKITNPDQSWFITYSSNRQREWIAGESTFTIADDSYLVTGNADGINRRGNHFTAVITSPLQVNLSCAYIVSGKITVTPDNLNPRYVDFGSGSCDSEIIVTVNGTDYQINLN